MTLATFWWHLWLLTKLFYERSWCKIMIPNIFVYATHMQYLDKWTIMITRANSLFILYESNVQFVLLLYPNMHLINTKYSNIIVTMQFNIGFYSNVSIDIMLFKSRICVSLQTNWYYHYCLCLLQYQTFIMIYLWCKRRWYGTKCQTFETKRKENNT